MSSSLEFRERPSFWSAYRGFLLTRRPGLSSSEDFPKLTAFWREVQFDNEALENYREACCIEREPGVPLHYPHVLASPLHLQIMTQPEFPLGLLGSLHLRNHVFRSRPIEVGETLTFQAETGECRFRPQGVEFDIDTEVSAASGVVWRERSTFLVRKKLAQEDPAGSLSEVFPWGEGEGEELTRFFVPRNAGKRYAKLTGDYNPIHVSKLAAKLFGFRRDLVHGIWGVARATVGMSELESEGPTRVDVAFKGPLYMENQIVVRSSPCESGRSLRLFCGKEARPAALVVVREVDEQCSW